jgi:hypothetical protein
MEAVSVGSKPAGGVGQSFSSDLLLAQVGAAPPVVKPAATRAPAARTVELQLGGHPVRAVPLGPPNSRGQTLYEVTWRGVTVQTALTGQIGAGQFKPGSPLTRQLEQAFRASQSAAEAPAARTVESQKPQTAAEPKTWAGQPFVGTVLNGKRFNGSNVFTVPQQIPGFGGKQIPLDLGGGGPGLVVYFPGAKTLFVTATEATVPVPAISKDTKLKWVATLSDKSMQVGLGNSIPIGGNASNVFFWNVRLNATDLARGATASLRGENKGKEIMLGTLNAGLLHKPSSD